MDNEEGKISELEDRAIDTIQNETEQNWIKKEQRINEMWGKFKLDWIQIRILEEGEGMRNKSKLFKNLSETISNIEEHKPIKEKRKQGN